MKIISGIKTIGLAIAIGVFTFACSQDTQNETNAEVDEAQTEMSEANVEMNDEMDELGNDMNRGYEDFSGWVQTNTTKAENITADEYRELRAEYNRRETELEAEASTWDDATRRQWEETKADWKRFEDKVQKRLGKIDDIDVDVDVNRRNN